MAITIKYFKSSAIEVFPAGFRGPGYQQSKLTTEKNFTRIAGFLSKNENNNNFFISDPYEAGWYILGIRGYIFRFSSSEIPPFTSSDKGTWYATIALGNVSTNSNPDPVGNVLYEVSESGGSLVANNNTLDVQIEGGGADNYFKGLFLILTDSALTSIQGASKVYSMEACAVSDAGEITWHLQPLRLSSTEIRNGDDPSYSDTSINDHFTTNTLDIGSSGTQFTDTANGAVISSPNKPLKINCGDDVTIESGYNKKVLIGAKTTLGSTTTHPVEITKSSVTVNEDVNVEKDLTATGNLIATGRFTLNATNHSDSAIWWGPSDQGATNITGSGIDTTSITLPKSADNSPSLLIGKENPTDPSNTSYIKLTSAGGSAEGSKIQLSATTGIGEVRKDITLEVNGSESIVTADTFKGALTGNADTATAADTATTADTAENLSTAPALSADGNQIKVTAGNKTSNNFTVPYAVNATHAYESTNAGTATVALGALKADLADFATMAGKLSTDMITPGTTNVRAGLYSVVVKIDYGNSDSIICSLMMSIESPNESCYTGIIFKPPYQEDQMLTCRYVPDQGFTFSASGSLTPHLTATIRLITGYPN